MVTQIETGSREGHAVTPDLAFRIGALVGKGAISERWANILLGREQATDKDVVRLLVPFTEADKVPYYTTIDRVLQDGDEPEDGEVEYVVEVLESASHYTLY